MQFGTFKLRVFENRVLREYLKLRGRKWRDNEELHNLYASSNIIGLIKSRRMRCKGYHAWQIKFWLEHLKGRDDSEELCMHRKTMLVWFLRKQGGKVWTGFIWLRSGASGRLL